MSDFCRLFKDIHKIAVNTARMADALEEGNGSKPHLYCEVQIVGTMFHFKGRLPIMFTLSDTQEVSVAVTAADAKGNPAAVTGVSFTSSDPTIVAVTDNGDGTATFEAVGPLGTAQITANASAQNAGGGTDPLVGTLDIQVVASEAVSLTISPGAPTEVGGGSTAPSTP